MSTAHDRSEGWAWQVVPCSSSLLQQPLGMALSSAQVDTMSSHHLVQFGHAPQASFAACSRFTAAEADPSTFSWRMRLSAALAGSCRGPPKWDEAHSHPFWHVLARGHLCDGSLQGCRSATYNRHMHVVKCPQSRFSSYIFLSVPLSYLLCGVVQACQIASGPQLYQATSIRGSPTW